MALGIMANANAPSEFGNQVDDLASSYSPEQLQQKYAVTQELIYLLALQKLKSEAEAVQRSLTASQQQMPGTVKQQLEQELVQDKVKQLAGIMGQNPNQQGQGQALPPPKQQGQPMPPPNQQMQAAPPTQYAASGGILGYASGGTGVTREELAEYGITPEKWNEFTDEEKEEVVRVIETGRQYTTGEGIQREIENIPTPGGGRLGWTMDTLRGIGNWWERNVEHSDFGKAMGWSDIGEEPEISERPRVESPTREQVEKTIQQIGYDMPMAPGATIPSPAEAREIQSKRGEYVPPDPSTIGMPPAPKPDSQPSEGGIGSLIKPPEAVDYTAQARKTAPKVADVAREGLEASLTAKAGLTEEDHREAERSRRQDRLDFFERDKQLQEVRGAYKEEQDTLQKLLDPKTQARQRRMAAFASSAGDSIGQSIANMTNAYLETEKGQNELERLAAKQKREGRITAADWDLEMLMDSANAGQAMYELSRVDKREAEIAFSNWAAEDLRAISNTANSLRQSRNAEIQASLARLQIMSEEFNRMNDREIADYGLATERLGQLNTERSVLTLETQNSMPRFGELYRKSLTEDGLTETEKTEFETIKLYITSIVNDLMKGSQEERDRLEKTTQEFRSRPDPAQAVANQYEITN